MIISPLCRGNSFSIVLLSHITRYPLIGISDIYKLAHQACLGSAHADAVCDRKYAQILLKKEIENQKEGPLEPAIDPISEDILRVNIRPYLRKNGDTDMLLDAFINTANAYRGSVDKLLSYWNTVRNMISGGLLSLEISEADAFWNKIQEKNYPAVHHSEIYKENYSPSYRVVAWKYLPEKWKRALL